MDLEMTGLDAERDVILQAAVIITNRQLEPLAELTLDVWQPAARLESMSPFVRDMHTKTGLLERVAASRCDVADAERQVLELVANWCSYPATVCGNSIWQDRKFIDRYMPGLGRYLHYRMLDVSAIKTVVARWYPHLQFQKSAEGEHDALVDVRNSIAEFQHYQQHLFVAP